MAQDKLEPGILPEDIISLFFQFLTKESQDSLALSSKMFGHSVYQKDRIKTKLLQQIKTDNLKIVRCLEKIRPDLRSIDFINYASNCIKQLWDDCLQDLGKKFAMSWLGATKDSGIWCARPHLQSLINLHKTQIEIDLPALLQRLESPVQNPDINSGLNCL